MRYSRADYEDAAGVLADCLRDGRCDSATVRLVAEAFARMFQRDNHLGFDAARFYENAHVGFVILNKKETN